MPEFINHRNGAPETTVLKSEYLRDTQGFVTDNCIVCGNEFPNPSDSSSQPMFCQKECSAVYRSDRPKYKELYKEQYLGRYKNG